MNVINYRVSLDMLDTSSQATIKAKKGDSACKIYITLSQNGKIYKMSKGSHATFSAKKSDGTFVLYDKCDIEGDSIVYDFLSSVNDDGCQITACAGTVECEVTLFNGSEQLTSPRFTLVVDGTVYNGEELKSSDEVNFLEDLIEKAEDTVSEIEEKLANGEFNGDDYVLTEADKKEIADIVDAQDKTELEQSNVLHGKKLVVLGDSFTHSVANSLITTDSGEKWQTIVGDNYDDTFPSVVYDRNAGQWVEQDGSYKTYDYWIAKRNNMSLFKLTEGGRTLSDINGNNSIAKVYSEIPADADYILIKIGVNDSRNSALSIGTIEYDDNGKTSLNIDKTTFCGAFNSLLQHLTRINVSGDTYPKDISASYDGAINGVKIGIIVTNGTKETVGTDIVNATIEVAKFWGIPYLNEDGDVNLPLVHSTVTRPVGSRAKSWASIRYSTANTNVVGWSDFHPNLLAHEMESTFVENFLRGL